MHLWSQFSVTGAIGATACKNAAIQNLPSHGDEKIAKCCYKNYNNKNIENR